MLKTLQSASDELLALSRDFWKSYGQLPITCFFENQDSQYGPLAIRVRILLLRKPLVVWLTLEKTVSSQSATFVSKRRMYLETDHSGLNKFWGEQDDNFQLFLPELKALVSHAINHHQKSIR